MKLHSINPESRLYVINSGPGFSCYGFDVLQRKASAVAQWASLPAPSGEVGTAEHFESCAAIMAAGAEYAARTGKRCNAELTPQFVGREGERVSITHADGRREHFTIGKSTGWMPIHLAIANRRSTGGAPVYLPRDSRIEFRGRP